MVLLKIIYSPAKLIKRIKIYWKLTETANENGSYITILETYTNLGPILDMLVVDIQKQGQGQVIINKF
jgi:hypothetical protein